MWSMREVFLRAEAVASELQIKIVVRSLTGGSVHYASSGSKGTVGGSLFALSRKNGPNLCVEPGKRRLETASSSDPSSRRNSM